MRIIVYHERHLLCISKLQEVKHQGCTFSIIRKLFHKYPDWHHISKIIYLTDLGFIKNGVKSNWLRPRPTYSDKNWQSYCSLKIGYMKRPYECFTKISPVFWFFKNLSLVLRVFTFESNIFLCVLFIFNVLLSGVSPWGCFWKIPVFCSRVLPMIQIAFRKKLA